jgi:hypothetical protein
LKTSHTPTMTSTTLLTSSRFSSAPAQAEALLCCLPACLHRAGSSRQPPMKTEGGGRGWKQGCQKLSSRRVVDANHPAPLRQPYQVKSKDVASACNCVRMAWMNWITLWKAVQTWSSVTHAYRKQIITLCAPGDNWGWPEAFS